MDITDRESTRRMAKTRSTPVLRCALTGLRALTLVGIACAQTGTVQVYGAEVYAGSSDTQNSGFFKCVGGGTSVMMLPGLDNHGSQTSAIQCVMTGDPNIHDVASAVGHASLEFRASDAAISVSGYSSVETTGELNSGVLGGVRGTATSDAGLLITVTPEVDSYVTFPGSLSIDAGGAGDGDSSGTIDFGGAGFNASLTDTAGSIARQTHLVHAGSRLTLVINANSFGFQQEKHRVTTISNAAPVTFSFAAVIASMSDADAATWRPLA
jgi:hypothetical protein